MHLHNDVFDGTMIDEGKAAVHNAIKMVGYVGNPFIMIILGNR